MKIAITGGGGYIGSVLTPLLLQAGHTVTVLDTFMYQQTSLLDVCANPALTVIRADARDERVLREAISAAEVIIPLACYTGAPLCAHFPEEARSIIVRGVELLLRLRSPRQMILYPNTNSGYGIGQAGIHCTEETPLNPVSHYGKLKVEAEKMILAAGNATVFRLATVFGVSPRMRLDLLVNDFVFRAVNDRFVVLFEAHFKRNYIHIRDVARAFLYAIEHDTLMKDQVYNVGLSDANLTKLELCQEIKRQLPDFYFVEAALAEDPDKRNYIVSNEKIEKTGFRLQGSLQQGITELIKGYQIIKRNLFSNI